MPSSFHGPEDGQYVNALAVFPRFGLHLIGEVVFSQRERHDGMVAAIGDVRLLVIRLTASAQTLERRQAQRVTGRTVGSSAAAEGS